MVCVTLLFRRKLFADVSVCAGLKCILTSMNAERTLIASECIGDARFFIDKVDLLALRSEF